MRGLEDKFMAMLRNCSSPQLLKRIHAQMEKKLPLSHSNFLVTRMLEICDQTGEIHYANLLFRRVSQPNTFLYNAMIKAFTRNRMYESSIDLYLEMLKQPPQFEIFPDRFTYPFVVRSCGGILSLCLGKQIHGHVCKFGLDCNGLIQNSLLDLYVKCDAVTDARHLFDEMTERDVISWNSLISCHMKVGQVRKARALFEEMRSRSVVSWTVMVTGYTRNGCSGEAMDVFRRMQMEGVEPDWVSLVAVLPSCAQSGALELGRWIHFYAEKKGFLRKISVCNALIEMYTKCGSVSLALQVFGTMVERDVISWSTMIAGLAHHGRAQEAIELFEEMQREGVSPNEITFVGLLSACSHGGMLQKGLEYFDSMKRDHNIEPGIEHYGCLVDLLGRTGHVDRALKLIKSMRMMPGSAIWGSLLSSCRSHRVLETAVVAAEHLLELEPDDTGNLVLLANIYADLGKWDEVSRMRKVMRSKSMKKTPGCSLVEVDSVVQEFVSGDESKAFSKDVYEMLDVLRLHQSREALDSAVIVSDYCLS